MLSPERHKVIMDHLRVKGNLSMKEMTEILGVSMDTVRRDIKQLEKIGSLKKVYGGVCIE